MGNEECSWLGQQGMLYSSMKCNGGFYEVHRVRISTECSNDTATQSLPYIVEDASATSCVDRPHDSRPPRHVSNPVHIGNQAINDERRVVGCVQSDAIYGGGSTYPLKQVEGLACLYGGDEGSVMAPTASSWSSSFPSTNHSQKLSTCKEFADDGGGATEEVTSSPQSVDVPRVTSATWQCNGGEKFRSKSESRFLNLRWLRKWDNSKDTFRPSIRNIVHLLIVTIALLGFRLNHLHMGLVYVLLMGLTIVVAYRAVLLRTIVEERVEIIKGMGIQISTVYRGGRMQREFVPLESILAVVINEAVTFNNCFFYLALLVRGEDDLVLLFEHLRPPLEVLVSVRHSLVAALGVDGRD